MPDTLALESEDIRKTFGHFTALAGVTLTVKRGEFLAVFARNGAGKTTFLKIAATLVRHTHGKLRVETSSRSFMHAGLRNSICIERTTKAKPGASLSASSNSAR